MIKRTLFFSSACHLNIKDDQLVITNRDTGKLNQVPAEDIGFVVLDNPAITFTQSVIQHFSENNASVVFCDSKHHPSSMLFHLDSNQTQTEKFRNQINAKEPLNKQLWQQTVKAKISNQAKLLKKLKIDSSALERIVKNVKSGDTTNEESKAARFYWKNLMGNDFRRDRYGLAPNSALNYGYAILRAAVARALAGSGLLPTLGIHHKNRYNSFCLADDIMEPYRPFVDKAVIELKSDMKEDEELTSNVKAELLQVLTCDIVINNKKRPLMVGLTETTASLARCFAGETNKILYPELL
jgi:CRISPR-associated protein Cas1